MMTASSIQKDIRRILNIPALLACWDFNTARPYLSHGVAPLELQEGNGALELIPEGVIGDTSIDIKEGQYLFIPRENCGPLDIYGGDAELTLMAWIKRKKKTVSQCEAIAGMWNETRKKRQYCLFLNLQLFDSADQVCGHISGLGGPTPGQRWCIDASIGQNRIAYDEWNFVAFTYDGKTIRSFRNGILDAREERNPYPYSPGIFNGGETGSDFTVGAVHRLEEMGNYFVGQLSGLAIFNKALQPEEIKKLQADFPLPTGNLNH